MNFLPLLSLSLACGLAVRMPTVAALLMVPVLAVPRLRPLRVHVLGFLAGTLLPLAPQPAPLIRALPEGAALVRVEGRVLRGPDRPANGRTSFLLAVDRVADRDCGGRVRILAPGDAPLPSPGARVRATGRLLRPRPAENPGETGAREARAASGLDHDVSVRTGAAVEVLAPAPEWSVSSRVHRSRLALDRALARSLPPRTSALLRCLLLGRRDLMDPERTDDFRRAGTSHLLAISGLHVGLLAGMLWLLLRPLPPRAAAVIVAAAALYYAALTGGRPPAVRAALLVTLAAAATLLRRPPRALPTLALAAIVVMLADPTSLSSAGFQLSFLAVLAILTLAPRFEAGLFARWILLEQFTVPRSRAWPVRRLRRYVQKGVPVSLAAWLATAPIALIRFGTISTLVLPANLLSLPLVALLLPAGLLAAATGFDTPAVLLAEALLGLTTFLSSIPGAAFTVPAPPLPLVAAYAGALVYAARRPTLGPRAAWLLLASLAVLTASGPLLRKCPPEPRLTVLSVGHGLCCVLETPEGGVLVYDAGSRRPATLRRVIVPFLRHRGISAIDVLLLSHDDADHVNAARGLRRALPIHRVIAPGAVRAGARIDLPGADAEVLAPTRPSAGNDGSTVLRVRANGLAILFSGDLEERGIASLLAEGRDVSAGVLVLPHHGRPCTASRALREAVGASTLISSDGPGDPLDAAWTGAVRTSERGAVTVRPGGRTTTFR